MSILNTVRYMTELFTFIMDADPGEEEEISQFDVLGNSVKLVVNDFIVSSVLKVVPSIPMAFVMPNTLGMLDTDYCIYVNKALWALPNDQIEAVLDHEVAHIENGDLEDQVRLAVTNMVRTFGLNRVSPMEAAADQAAVDNGNGEGLYYALRSIRDAMNKEGLAFNKEINLRIKELKQYRTYEE